MRKELTYQIVKQNSENSAQGTNVPNSLTELKEKTAQSTNVTNNLRQLKENSAQDTNVARY